jgi:hypothetical protein
MAIADKHLYVTEDERDFVHDGIADQLYDMAEQDLEIWEHSTPPDFYLAILRALGKEPVIDIGERR